MTVTINGTTGIVTPDIGIDGTTFVVDSVNDRIGIGTDNPASLLHLQGSAPRITFTDTAGTDDIGKIFSSSGALYIQQRDGSAHGEIIFRTENNATAVERLRINSSGLMIFPDVAADKIQLNGAVNNYYRISKLSGGGTLGDGEFKFTAGNTSAGGFTFHSGGTERLRITSDGQLQATSAADVRLTLGSSGTAGTNDSVHIRADSASLKFMSASGGSTIFEANGTETVRITSDGKIEVKGTRAGSLQASDDDALKLFTKSTSNDINRGVGITFYTHDGSGFEMGGTIQVAKENGTTNDAKSYMRFSTQSGSTTTERLRIKANGNVLVGSTTTLGTATPVNLSLGGSYSTTPGSNPKFNVWDDGTGYMSLGVSSNQMDFLMSSDDYDFVWYGRNDSNTGTEERMRLDNGEKLLDFAGTSKIRLRGAASTGTTHAHLSIGSQGGANTDTRAIDIWGSWQDQESKSITYNHGTVASQMVCQQRVRYNTAPSSTYYEIGRFYHGQDTTAFPVRFVSTSTTTANLELDGNLKVPSGNGVDFSSSGAYSGNSSSVLDDYEEGVWTPSGYSGATVTTNRAYYVKVGRIVTVWFTGAITSPNSGAFYINLPFAGVTAALSGAPAGRAAGVEAHGALMVNQASAITNTFNACMYIWGTQARPYWSRFSLGWVGATGTQVGSNIQFTASYVTT